MWGVRASESHQRRVRGDPTSNGQPRCIVFQGDRMRARVQNLNNPLSQVSMQNGHGSTIHHPPTGCPALSNGSKNRLDVS
jgi:hypothetical protein